jgi:hypothetical protein
MRISELSAVLSIDVSRSLVWASFKFEFQSFGVFFFFFFTSSLPRSYSKGNLLIILECVLLYRASFITEMVLM